MGFLDKAKAAASTAKSAAVAAKSELDKSGLVDQLKAKGGDSGNDVEPPAPDRDALSEMLDSIRRGAIDPRTVISQAEVEAIAGHAVRPSEPGFNGDFVYVTFSGADERYGVHCLHTMDDDYPWDADEQWGNIRDVFGDGATEVDGIGDDAIRQGQTVYFRVGSRVLFAEVTGGKLRPDALAVRAEQLARTVARNVAALS